MIKAVCYYILLPQQPNLNVIERKFKRQILKPYFIIHGWLADLITNIYLVPSSI